MARETHGLHSYCVDMRMLDLPSRAGKGKNGELDYNVIQGDRTLVRLTKYPSLLEPSGTLRFGDLDSNPYEFLAHILHGTKNAPQ